MKKAVFFDRDGVINELIERTDGSFTSPWSLSEFRFLPKVKESINSIQSLGYMTFIVTNQPGINDGDMDKKELDSICEMLLSTLQIDEILCALDKNSSNYKPQNGMIEYLINKYDIDRNNSYLIGDRWKDIVPGNKSGLKTIFVGNEYICPPEYTCYPVYKTTDIYAACNTIMEIENAR